MSTRTNTRSRGPSLKVRLEGAERICRDAGLRLTAKRRRLLETLLRAKTPLSAYELADAHRREHDEDLPIMTVYRMLDVFMEAGVVHKIRSTNRFLPCSHLACDHPHAGAQFLICDSCGFVREMDFGDKEIAQLDRKARSTGFSLNREQLELHGICDDCQVAAD
jgi:Fur family zinc uptake transcriptional regulator